MCKCDVIGCRYSDFLGNDSIYYVKDDNTCEEFCLFHIPEKIKDNVLASQKKLLKDKIVEYIEYIKAKGLKTIDFSSCVFHEDFPSEALRDKDFKDDTFDFSHTIFYKYFSIKNLKCETLKFKDTEFLEGGAIKNRGSSESLYIKNLIFRPFRLDADFVIDLGRYANKESTIEDSYGVIDDIVFENHKLGSGRVHFIGLNDKMTQADFRNRILDNVSFQNCDLSKCYFLNAKVDETEFRNCKFLYIKDFSSNRYPKYYSFIINIVMIIGLIIVVYFTYDNLIHSKIEQEPGLFLLIYVLLYLLININFSEHIGFYDEKELEIKDDKIKKEVNKILIENYKMMKKNLLETSFQESGEFTFSHKFLQISYLYKGVKNDYILNILYYLFSGFGERYLRVFIGFFVVIIIFSVIYEPNKDFIATDMTPPFLLSKKLNDGIYYKNQQYLDINNTKHKREYIPNKLLNCPDKKSKENKENCVWDKIKVQIYYSASQFISPFTSKNRAWFKTVSQKASIFNLVEMVLLYLFFGAFVLAIKNRIKR